MIKTSAETKPELLPQSTDRQRSLINQRYWPQSPIDVFNVPQLADIESEAHTAAKLAL